jgi:predicted nucleotidyltransferase
MTNDEAYRLIAKVVYGSLDKDKVKVFVFGSRAIGDSRKFSDIDVGIDMGGERVPAGVFLELQDRLSESDIPYVVDLVDFKNVNNGFRKLAMSKIINLAEYAN